MKFSKAILAISISLCSLTGWSAQENTKGLLPEVKLTGPARLLILPNDSIYTESEDF